MTAPASMPLRRPPLAATSLAANQSAVIEDDGRTLWISPTDGPPLELAYLPLGVQVVAMFRPAVLAEHPEGDKVRSALGPLGKHVSSFLQQATGMKWEEIERLSLGFQIISDGRWRRTMVVYGREEIDRENIKLLDGAQQQEYLGISYWAVNESAYYWPQEGGGRTLVITTVAAVKEIIELAGEAPPLRRDLERLLPYTDADRHVTIVLSPSSHFNEGASIFDGAAAGLREPLFWFLGDEFSAAALSLHWRESFFVELLAVPTLEASPERAARILVERVEQTPEKMGQHIAALQPSSFAQSVVARFPAMLRTMATYTRSGFNRDLAVLRAYLPAIAGHNLLMAAELTLAESRERGPVHFSGPSSPRRAMSAKNGPVPFSMKLSDRLQHIISLRFPRDTLEAALEQLSADIGIEIMIRGNDLQEEGITKNQSFGIDIQDRPAEEILLEILRLANPDKTATGPADERQKLVYVIESTSGESDRIIVTTRAAAAERGDELPAAFRGQPR